MHTLIAILLSMSLNIGRPAPDRKHYEIFIVSGQSNAREMYAEGVRRAIEDSHLFTNPIIFHRNHSGQSMVRWVQGTDGNYTPGNLMLADFESPLNSSRLESLIRSIRLEGSTWEISGFFWFQGESDSGFYGQIIEYEGRFRYMLDQISVLQNRGRPIPFVMTAIDYNHNLEDELEYPIEMIEFLRSTQYQIAADDPYGLIFDSRGWPRVDLWHVGDQDDPNGQYGAVRDLGYEQGVALIDAFAPAPCPPDFSDPYRVLDSSDVQAFFRLFYSKDPLADFNSDGELDFFDVELFFEAFDHGCKD